MKFAEAFIGASLKPDRPLPLERQRQARGTVGGGGDRMESVGHPVNFSRWLHRIAIARTTIASPRLALQDLIL